jgi:outer membrane receptor protein involved in Fe transport
VQDTGKTYTLNLNVVQSNAIAAGDYMVHNFNIGYRWKNWRITAFARNLTDEDILLFNGPLNDDVITFGRPRQLGITLDAKF